MVDRLEIVIVETKRFRLDCALYGFREAEKEREVIEILNGDPTIGVTYDGNAALRVWNFAAYDIFSAISGEFSKLVLVELRPHGDTQVKLIERLFDAVEKTNAFKGPLGF